jgi:hypothetical protein
MSESKRKDDATRTAATNVIETARDNTLRIIDEVAKAQPQYAQAVSNLQTDFIQTTKNFVQTAFETQRQLAQNLNIPQNQQISELVAKQTAEMTSNVIRAIGTYNQLSINAIDAARENTKIFNRTIDAVTDFSTNIVKAWTGYWASQQQQFTRAY